jgi:hypothetical protein
MPSAVLPNVVAPFKQPDLNLKALIYKAKANYAKA